MPGVTCDFLLFLLAPVATLQSQALCHPFLFNQLRIANCASPLFLYSYKLPGGCTPLSSFSGVPYTLPSSVYPKSFVCHSYENCRGSRTSNQESPQKNSTYFPFWTSLLPGLPPLPGGALLGVN